MKSFFCILPWIHLHIGNDGSQSACCVAKPSLKDNLNQKSLLELQNSEYLKNIRKDMVSGKIPDACVQCKLKESHGMISHRNIENKLWADRGVQIFDVIRDMKNGRISENIKTLDLRLGNVCNLKCVMCRPHDSKKWIKDAETFSKTNVQEVSKDFNDKLLIKRENYRWYDAGTFWDDLKTIIPSLQEIVLAGGEPMMIKRQYDVLKYAIDSGYSKNIILRYHTNGTRLPEEVMELWKKFKVIDLSISMDCVGDKEHWLRYPTDWEKKVRYLHEIDKMADNVHAWFLCTLNALNVFYVPEYVSWIKKQKFKKIGKNTSGYFHPSTVLNPSYLSFESVPPELKKIITTRIDTIERLSDKKNPKIPGIIELLNSNYDPKKHDALKAYIKMLDNARGLSFVKTFPEISEFFV